MSESRTPQAHASSSFWWLGVIAAALLGFSTVGIVLGMQSLLGSTEAARRAVACCGTIFSSCLASPSMLRATIPWLGMGILLYGLLRGLWNAVRTIRANHRFLSTLQELPAVGETSLGRLAAETGVLRNLLLIDIPGRRQAFTAGFLSPRIYLTREICEALSDEEIKAVLLHEDHHRRNRDPLRALVIMFLQDLLFLLPVGYVLGRVFFEAREDAADDAVVAQGGDRLDLAGALCLLARLETVEPQVAALGRITGQGRIQRRVERLLSPHREGMGRPRMPALILSVVIGALLLTSLYLPILIGGPSFEFQGCSPTYCEGMECMKR